MSSSAAKLSASDFLRVVVDRLRATPFEQIAKWPEYPKQPDIDLHVPGELANHTFTLMKDTRANGDIRVGVQCYRQGLLASRMSADGFIVSPNGNIRPLSEQDMWNLT
jgi:hypothetical protein